MTNSGPESEMSFEAITDLLGSWQQESNNPEALAEAVRLLYPQLRQTAHSLMRRESRREHHTLNTQALLNEAYLRMAESGSMAFSGRAQFLFLAGKMMRHILVEHARSKSTEKRGAGRLVPTPEEGLDSQASQPLTPSELLDLDRALDQLAEIDSSQAQIVELKHFAGLANREIATIMDISVTSVERKWRIAKRWLARALRAGSKGPA